MDRDYEANVPLLPPRPPLRSQFVDNPLGIPTAITERETAALVRLATGHLVLEVGALLGYSTVTLATTALHVVSLDPHDGYPAHDPSPTLGGFLANVLRHDMIHKVTPVIGRDDVLPMLAPGAFGLVFIDTTGEFEDTARIIRAVLPLLAPYASLAVHDCGHPDWPGALVAVHEFAAEMHRDFEVIDRLAIFEGIPWR
jgi:predicted O-methyltransferase YrrM